MGELTIDQAFRRVVAKWPIVLASTIAFIAVASFYLHFAIYRYTVSYGVTPAQSSSTEGLASKFGGLASVAGLSLPSSNGEAQYQLYLESLTSTVVASELAKDPEIMHGVFDTEWDAANRRWRRPPDRFASIKRPIKFLLGFPDYTWIPPSSLKLRDYLSRSIKVEQTPKVVVATVSFKHKDPRFAVRLLTELDAAADRVLRQRSLVRSTDYIAYLTRKLQGVTLTEQRIAITQALSEQERNRMMASSTLPFAAEVFSTPSASLTPTSPDPRLVIAAAIVLGFLVGVLIVLVPRRARD